MLTKRLAQFMGSWQLLVINTQKGFKAEGRGQKAEGGRRKKEEGRSRISIF